MADCRTVTNSQKDYVMETVKTKSNKFFLFLLILAVIILSIISFLLNLPLCGYFLMYFPLLFGVALTWGIYPHYSKSLKSYIDGILYFQSSIVAILLVIGAAIPVPKDFFLKYLQSLPGFFYVYAMAIVAVIKCCVSFRDGKTSYTEEKNKIFKKKDINESNENKTLPLVENKLSTTNGYKINILIGASVLTLIILIFK